MIRMTKTFSLVNLPRLYEWTRFAPGLINAKRLDLSSFLALFKPILATGLSWSVWDDSNLVGGVIFQPITYPGDMSAGDGFIHFGLDRSMWGKKVLQSLGPSMIRVMFDSSSIRRLSAWIVGENRPVTSLTLAMGFTPEGVIRAGCEIDGVTQDFNLYGLLRSEFDVLWNNTNPSRD